MGVPKFFRFISERYPLISTPFPVDPPKVDNLYLDMNGIIHNCVHSSPGNTDLASSKRYADIPTAARSPNDIYLDVFKYVDNLVSLLTPRRLLYLAVDGVAPRAKMNQQRSRRFRSARERAEEHERKQRDDPIYKAARVTPFDSNCITPGTAFMYGLSHALRFFVARKISEDPTWKSITVVLSGPESPGEGEHKLMEYIRAVRESNKLPANTRHCVYGLDADLIMLAIVTHEPDFFLLREKVDFTAFWKKKNGPRTASALDIITFGEFELMSIGVVREYITLELGADGNNHLPFFDKERVLDDFVFILMLIGNDFLPNLPTLDIADGTLSVMLHLYKRIFPLLGGYLTDAGSISPLRFEFFLSKLALLEEEVLRHRKELASSSSRDERGGRKRGARTLSYSPSELDNVFELYAPEGSDPLPQPLPPPQLRQEIASIKAILENNIELTELKNEYYAEKFGREFMDIDNPDPKQRHELVRHYVEGICWTLKYYTEGCRQWRWYFPFHYAPLASDIGSVESILQNAQFQFLVKDTPFCPWEQLLSVLPPSSSWCLPKPYQALMMSAGSTLREFYPAEFKTDLNCKRNDWEAVVLLPFVDEKRLLSAIASIRKTDLSELELACNTLGPALVYQYCDKPTSTVIPSPFPNRLSSFTSRVKTTPLQLPFIREGCSFSPFVTAGTKPATEFNDLPTLGHYSFEPPELLSVGVNIFGTPSRNTSLVLRLKPPTSSYEGKCSSSDEEDDNDDRDGTKDEKSDSGQSSSRAHMQTFDDQDYENVEPTTILSNRGLTLGFPACYSFPWARVCSIQTIMTASTTYSIEGSIVVSRPTPPNIFQQTAAAIVSMMLQKCAIDISKPKIIIGVREERPISTETKTSSEQNPANDEIIHQHEYMIRKSPPRLWDDLNAPADKGNYKENAQLSSGQVVLYVGHGAYFGHLCTVQSTSNKLVKVKFNRAVGAAREPPFGYRVVSASNAQRWLPLSRLAAEVGFSIPTIDAFLGSVRVKLAREREEVDIGLGVKYIARGLYVPGYARRDDRNHFTFSERCVQLLRRYSRAFPALFTGIESRSRSSMKGNVVHIGEELLPRISASNVDDALRAAQAWLAVQDIAKVPLVHTRSEVLPRDAVLDLERQASIMIKLREDYEATLTGGDATCLTKEVLRITLRTGREGLDPARYAQKNTQGFSPSNTFHSDPQFLQHHQTTSNAISAPQFFDPVSPLATGLRLGDRVVNWLVGATVPFGLRGSVVGIHPPAENDESGSESPKTNIPINTAFVEVVFDEGFIGGGSLGGRCSDGRGKAVEANSLFIIRPERDNAYYSKKFARAAARVSPQASSSTSGGADTDSPSEAVAKAAMQRFEEAVNKIKEKQKKSSKMKQSSKFVKESETEHNLKSNQDVSNIQKTVQVAGEASNHPEEGMNSGAAGQYSADEVQEFAQAQLAQLSCAEPLSDPSDPTPDPTVESLDAKPEPITDPEPELELEMNQNAVVFKNHAARCSVSTGHQQREHFGSASAESNMRSYAEAVGTAHRTRSGLASTMDKNAVIDGVGGHRPTDLVGTAESPMPLPSFVRQRGTRQGRSGGTSGQVETRTGGGRKKNKNQQQKGHSHKQSGASHDVKLSEAEILAQALLKQMQVKEQTSDESSRVYDDGCVRAKGGEQEDAPVGNDNDDEYVALWRQLQSTAGKKEGS